MRDCCRGWFYAADGSLLPGARALCAPLDFAGSATLSRCFSLKLIFNPSEVTWLWVNQMNNLGLVRVWGTHK